MKSKIKQMLTVLVVLSLSTLAHAQSGSVTDSNGSNYYQQRQQNQGSSGIHNDAGDGKSQQLVGAAANVAGMVLMMKFCAGEAGVGPSCIMAAMAGATIPIMLQGASDSGRTESASFGGGLPSFDDPNFDPNTDAGGLSFPGLDPNTVVPGPNGTNTTVGQLVNTTRDLNGQLNDLGYSADASTQTIDTPDGPVSFSEANGMAAGGGGSGGGLPPALASELSKLSKDYEKVADGYRVVSSKTKSGGGGRSKAKSFNFGGGKDPFASYLNSLNKGKRKPTSVKGLKKIVDGTAIGVGGDDIFDMVHRKYQSKRGQSLFFERTFKRPRQR